MDKSQLPLIALLSLDDVVEPAPSRRPVSKHAHVSDLPYLNAVQALLQGPMPLAQLVRLEAAIDGTSLVNALRQFGLQLPIHQVPVFDINYDVSLIDVCALTVADTRRVNRVLKNVGGRDA
jgi:hypothetical protein